MKNGDHMYIKYKHVRSNFNNKTFYKWQAWGQKERFRNMEEQKEFHEGREGKREQEET